MAKTIMVSNKVYGELKAIKGDKSFSEVITGLMEKESQKTLGNVIKKHKGILKGDKEYGKIRTDIKKEWKKWTGKYV